MNIFGKNVLVVGMRSSGISATNLLLSKGAEVYCYDDAPFGLPRGAKRLESVSEKTVAPMELIVVSPSIPPTHPSILFGKQLSKKIIGETELGCSFLSCPVIAVTGTNGKSTVVTMVEKLLTYAGFSVKAMGNIGYPVSQVVLDGTALDYAVVEVSSFQLEHIETFHPYIASVLNLAPDHMDRYENYGDYVETKRKILLNQNESDYFVFNDDDGAVRKFALTSKARRVPVGNGSRKAPAYLKDNYFMFNDESVCHVKQFKIRGEHNKFNLLVTMNIGAIVGCKKEHFLRLIKNYALLPNRIEYVVTVNGKSYYNDSKGTNIHACRHAVESVEGNVGLIMGGSSKNEDFCEFFENIDEKIKYIAVTGGNAEEIVGAALKMGYTDIGIFDSLPDAVRYLSRSPIIDTVLLSPACASFDRYKSYSERGEKFKEAIYGLKK